MASKATDERTQVLAYLRVSTDEQGRSGLGLQDQREAIERAAEYKRWDVVEWIEDHASGKSLERPGMQRALELLEDGGPDILVTAKLDRLSRSALDFLTLAERAKEQGWSIVVLDMGKGDTLDMSSPIGKFTASILASVAELEREMISSRTKAALAQAKANGTKLGRKLNIARSTVERIEAERAAGKTLQDIADDLNADEVPTARGGEWWPSTVSYVLKQDRSDWPARTRGQTTKGEG